MKRVLAVTIGTLALVVLLFGCLDQPNRAPQVLVLFTKNPVVGEATDFDASISFDPDGSIVSYQWDFGDKTMAKGPEVSHRYQSAGTFDVRLTVMDEDGAESTRYFPVEIAPVVCGLTVSIQDL